MFSDKSIAESQKYETLGPAYFEAREIVDKHMAKFEPEHFKPLIESFTKQLQETLLDSLHNHLLTDTEMNLHGSMYRMVDDCIEAILSGDVWALKRYALGKYNQEAVRQAVAKYIPQEIQDARIADLEKEVASLRDTLKFYRNR